MVDGFKGSSKKCKNCGLLQVLNVMLCTCSSPLHLLQLHTTAEMLQHQ